MALGVLAQDKTRDHRIEAIRLIILAIGDYHLYSPSVEVCTAYEPASSLQGYEGLMVKVRTLVRPILPSGNAAVDFEAARLLAMLEDNDPASPRKVLAYFSDLRSPASDFHYLTVLSRLKAALPTNATAQAAPLFRKQWSNLALRDELVVTLARNPQLIDRDKFITGLASLQSHVARASMPALLQLPREESGKTLVPALRLLRRLLNEPAEQ